VPYLPPLQADITILGAKTANKPTKVALTQPDKKSTLFTTFRGQHLFVIASEALQSQWQWRHEILRGVYPELRFFGRFAPSE
jgi:hypothetical protein